MPRLLLFVLFFFLTAYAKERLIASTYAIYYPLSHMAGSFYEVELLIKAQADVHHYELKPTDMRRLLQSKAFFYLGVEPWEQKVAKSLPRDKGFPLSQGLELIQVGRSYDPHVWLSPRAYIKLVERLRDSLIRLDPPRREEYIKRAEEYIKRLKSLDEEFSRTLSTCRIRLVVITHASLGYLARDYGLEMVGLRGVHAEEEPKPSEVRAIIERAKKAGVRFVFYELGHDRGLAQRFAGELSARVLPINTSLVPEAEGDDYFSIMRRNLKRLSEGLECRQSLK